MERDVQPAYKKSEFEKRPFGTSPCHSASASCQWSTGAVGSGRREKREHLRNPGVLHVCPLGHHMDVDKLMAMQTRIETQEEPKVASVSFDRNAANVFQVCDGS